MATSRRKKLLILCTFVSISLGWESDQGHNIENQSHKSKLTQNGWQEQHVSPHLKVKIQNEVHLSPHSMATNQGQNSFSSPSSTTYRYHVGKQNLENAAKYNPSHSVLKYLPGMAAPGFKIPTLRGDLIYPSKNLTVLTPMIFHSFNPESGFLCCFWNCSGTMSEFVPDSPNDTHYIFLSNTPDAFSNALWMRDKFVNAIEIYERVNKKNVTLFSHLHFVTLPLNKLGNWIPEILWDWHCQDHGCGLDQIKVKISGKPVPLVLKRLDARYDWLPSPKTAFGNKQMNLSFVGNTSKGCESSPHLKGKIAILVEGGCSYFQKVLNMQTSGAIGVIVLQTESPVLQDMNCEGSECSQPLSIPASMVPYHKDLIGIQVATITYQNTVSENFFFGVDHQGDLAEFGWLLFPTFRFLAWQAQWFTFKKNLHKRLQQEKDVLEVSVFNKTVMVGQHGAVANITIPDMKILSQYERFELDMSMSCPGDLDQDCPHWDRIIPLYVCCNLTSPLCQMELGRWISPFRRRIGRWLTRVDSLLPLLTSTQCMFSMKSATWDPAWLVTLTLRFSNKKPEDAPNTYPFAVVPLYQPSFVFDQSYNSHFKRITFAPPPSTKKVVLTSVITGHGSDENGCGEFCVTSHHFVVNGHTYNRTFSNAGSPFGCAERVLQGVEPNEHGTWLYGRDGWCDGQQVEPWVIDITAMLTISATVGSDANYVSYFGWFNGKDPQPKRNPGMMQFSSYLTFYKEIS